jgi:hypothetical protein
MVDVIMEYQEVQKGRGVLYAPEQHLYKRHNKGPDDTILYLICVGCSGGTANVRERVHTSVLMGTGWPQGAQIGWG